MADVLASAHNLSCAILTISAMQTTDEAEAMGTTHLNYMGWNLADGAQMSAVTERIHNATVTERDLSNSVPRIGKYWKRLGRAGFGSI